MTMPDHLATTPLGFALALPNLRLGQPPRPRQAILREAFAGRLVPQDPTDEPASELLARLQANRPTPTRRKRQASRNA